MSNIVELEPKKAQALQMLLEGEKGVYEIERQLELFPVLYTDGYSYQSLRML